jgi:hypothetical protein
MYFNFVGALLIKSDVHQLICMVYLYPSKVKTRLFSIFLTRKGLAIEENEVDASGFMHMCQHAIVHSKIWWQNTSFVSGDRDLFGKFIKATTNGKALTNTLAHSSHICTSWVHIVIGNDCIVERPCFQHLSYLQASSKHYAFIMLLWSRILSHHSSNKPFSDRLGLLRYFQIGSVCSGRDWL